MNNKESRYLKLREIREKIQTESEKYLLTEEDNGEELLNAKVDEIIYLSKNKDMLLPFEKSGNLTWMRVYAVLSFILAFPLMYVLYDSIIMAGGTFDIKSMVAMVVYLSLMGFSSYLTFGMGKLGKYAMIFSTLLSFNYIFFIVNLVYLSVNWKNPLLIINHKKLKQRRLEI